MENSKNRKLSICALNIVTHPHSTSNYIDLFRYLRKTKTRGIINKSRMAYIGPLSQSSAPDNCLVGSLFFFKSIDTTQPWLNIDVEELADESDLSVIKKQAETYKPECRIMQFIFSASNHRFYFETQNERNETFSPNIVQKVFLSMLDSKKVIERFGQCEVTIIPSEDAIDKIFKLPSLRKLTIDLVRPNADDLVREERIVLDKMLSMHVKREQRQYTKEKGAITIEPDEDTKILAKVAAQNGHVVGEGRDHDGEPIMESTKQHPLTEVVRYDERHESRLSALISYVRSKLRRR